MSQKNDNDKSQADKPWDKTFEDDRDDSGNLSRTQKRKQDSSNSTLTTVLVVLILLLALAPIGYFLVKKNSLNNPQQTEQVAS